MSSPNICPLNKANVKSANYFVDANVWIYSLQQWDTLKDWEDHYYQFFYDIIESKINPQPKILLPALLVSEIVNTYLRKFAIPEYKYENRIPDHHILDFKRDYRPTQHFADSYEKIMDDIKGLSASIRHIDDRGIAHDPAILFNKSIGDLDYNDHLYYHLCKDLMAQKERVIILTHDKDYYFKDIEIVTSNRDLLAK